MPSALSCDPESLLERLLACARRTPEAVAIRDAHGELRYGELVKRAYRLARALAARGVGPERTVGVCLPRGGDLVAAELGVMLSGGAFVPVDAESPRERLRAIFADAGATCVVTEPPLEARRPGDLEAISAASFRSAGREDLETPPLPRSAAWRAPGREANGEGRRAARPRPRSSSPWRGSSRDACRRPRWPT